MLSAVAASDVCCCLLLPLGTDDFDEDMAPVSSPSSMGPAQRRSIAGAALLSMNGREANGIMGHISFEVCVLVWGCVYFRACTCVRVLSCVCRAKAAVPLCP